MTNTKEHSDIGSVEKLERIIREIKREQDKTQIYVSTGEIEKLALEYIKSYHIYAIPKRTDDLHSLDTKSTHYQVKLSDGNITMSAQYSQGSAHKTTPTLGSILRSLVSDWDAGQHSFEDFCWYYGYDTDSRTALRTHAACVATSKSMERMISKNTLLKILKIAQEI